MPSSLLGIHRHLKQKIIFQMLCLSTFIWNILLNHYFHISRVLAYVQIGTFIIVLMCTSWFFATFFLQSCLHILGPSAFSLDSIPQDTCCGQRIKQKKKKKQRETWQPKVALKEDSGSLRWLHLMKFSLKIKTEFSKISPVPLFIVLKLSKQLYKRCT